VIGRQFKGEVKKGTTQTLTADELGREHQHLRRIAESKTIL
jgi:hypothetical protein